MDREYARYAKANGSRLGHGAKSSFQLGMANRINQRIRAMCAERDATQNASASRALVLVSDKKVAVAAYAQKVWPRLRSSSTSYSSGNGGAFSAGRAAGDRVGFGRPIGGGQGLLN
jgi:hypothetical protein